MYFLLVQHFATTLLETLETDCYLLQFRLIFTQTLTFFPQSHMNSTRAPFGEEYLFFPLWAIPLPPLCWLRAPAGATILSAPRGEANPWGSSETRVAPASWPTCMTPLARLPWLPIEGSSWTTRLTCCTVGDSN